MILVDDSFYIALASALSYVLLRFVLSNEPVLLRMARKDAFARAVRSEIFKGQRTICA